MAENKSNIVSNDTKLIDKYELLRNAYYSTGGFETGDYIVKHRRESKQKLEERKQIAFYLNYIQPLVDLHVSPLFKHEANRDYKENTGAFDAFFNDIDLNNTTLPRFMKSVALASKLYGVAFVVIDNFSDIPATLGNAVKERKLPYCYVIEPDAVVSYKLDKFGRLTEFVISEEDNKRTFAMDGWKLTNRDGNTIESGSYNFGRLPVVPVFSRQPRKGDIKPQPEFYSMAKVNFRIYNLCSELDEILRNQAFSILTFPHKPMPDGTGNTRQITLGTDNILGFDGATTSHAPAFIAPPSDPAKLIMEQIDRLITEIYRMAVLSHITGTEVKQQSGVSKEWDNQQLNSVLADFSQQVELVEKQIVQVFSFWMNIKFDYSSTYNKKFGLVDTLTAINEAMEALNLGIGGHFNKEVKKKVTGAIFPDLSQERFNQIIEDIETMADDETLFNQTQNQNNNSE